MNPGRIHGNAVGIDAPLRLAHHNLHLFLSLFMGKDIAASTPAAMKRCKSQSQPVWNSWDCMIERATVQSYEVFTSQPLMRGGWLNTSYITAPTKKREQRSCNVVSLRGNGQVANGHFIILVNSFPPLLPQHVQMDKVLWRGGQGWLEIWDWTGQR